MNDLREDAAEHTLVTRSNYFYRGEIDSQLLTPAEIKRLVPASDCRYPVLGGFNQRRAGIVISNGGITISSLLTQILFAGRHPEIQSSSVSDENRNTNFLNSFDTGGSRDVERALLNQSLWIRPPPPKK